MIWRLLVWASVAGVVAGLTLPGLTYLLWVATPLLGIAVVLVLLGLVPRRTRPATLAEAAKAAPESGLEPRQNWIIVDGSNVLYWKDKTPQIDTVRAVVEHLTARGFVPGVVFDANAGYLVGGRYEHDGALGRRLGLPEDQVMVVEKGTQADPMILNAARHLGARVVTNDRYRDWADAHPEVGEPGFLVRGRVGADGPWLDLDQPAKRA